MYVGSDGKLHFVNRDGADTALNFSRTYVDTDSTVCSNVGAEASLYNPNSGNVSTYLTRNSYSNSFSIPKTLNKGYLYAVTYSTNCFYEEQYGGSGSANGAFSLTDGSTALASATYYGTSSNTTNTVDFGANYRFASDGSLTLSISASAEAGRGTNQYSGSKSCVRFTFVAKYKVPKYST